MNLNFKEALATLSRALPLVLLRAGVYVAGGFMVIVLFAMQLFASRFAGPVAIIVVLALAVPGWWVSGRVLQRFFLFRHRAAMLFLFSGRFIAACGLAAAIHEAGRFFPDHSRWAVINLGLRRTLSAFYRGNGDFPLPPAAAAGGLFLKILDRLSTGPFSQAILALSYSRGGSDPKQAIREGLALYFRHGTESRRLARRWVLFSAIGLLFLFLCLAIPNWIFFRSTGTPVWIGIVLAAVIARLLHQAFIVPFVLAGVSAALLVETKGHAPDPEFCEKLTAFFPDVTLTGEH